MKQLAPVASGGLLVCVQHEIGDVNRADRSRKSEPSRDRSEALALAAIDVNSSNNNVILYTGAILR